MGLYCIEFYRCLILGIDFRHDMVQSLIAHEVFRPYHMALCMAAKIPNYSNGSSLKNNHKFIQLKGETGRKLAY